MQEIEEQTVNAPSNMRRVYAFAVVTMMIAVIAGFWIVNAIRNAPPTSSVVVEEACFVEPAEEAACSVAENENVVTDLEGGLALPGLGDPLALSPDLGDEVGNEKTGDKACLRSANGEGCLRFPTINGLNLIGHEMTLPVDFSGEWNLVIVPFSDEQQVNAESWLPLAETLAAQAPSVRYYNVPVFPDIAPPIRLVIRAGMNLAITERDLQALSITVFLDDRDAFLAALEIPDVEAMQVFLLNELGEVYWRGVGAYDETQANALKSFFN